MRADLHPTVLLRFPDGSQFATALPGVPRRGDTVSVRWGRSENPTLYSVEGVVWDVNDVRIVIEVAPAQS